MKRHSISTDQAPAAIGPYSQAVVAGGFVFVSGTAGINPATGWAPLGIEAQAEQALLNMAAVLAAAGASMADVVKTTTFYAQGAWLASHVPGAEVAVDPEAGHLADPDVMLERLVSLAAHAQ